MDNTSLADVFGWIGNVGFILGLYYLARLKRPIPSMWWNIFGNSLYVLYSVLLLTPSLVVLSLVLITMNLYGIRQWKKENHEDRDLSGKA